MIDLQSQGISFENEERNPEEVGQALQIHELVCQVLGLVSLDFLIVSAQDIYQSCSNRCQSDQGNVRELLH
jgi:hypothetical protein